MPQPDPNPDHLSDPQRRALLLASVAAAAVAPIAIPPALLAQAGTVPPGKPGEFDFLAGNWKIAHRRKTGPDKWDAFPGEATCWTILGGVGSVEELRIPARDFSGMGLRLLDVEKKIWSDFWVNAKSGVLTTPGTIGGFVDGVGTFESEYDDNGKTMKVRGVWDRITKTGCRWRQGSSSDGGKSWTDDWIMDWTRAS